MKKRAKIVILAGLAVSLSALDRPEPRETMPTLVSPKEIGADYFDLLPPEQKIQVIQALTQMASFDDAIEAIRSIGLVTKDLNDILNDPRVVRGLIRDLAKKYNKSLQEVARALNTPGSKNYIKKSEELFRVVKQKPRVQQVQRLIDAGADVLFQLFILNIFLESVTGQKEDLERELAILELLLRAGATPSPFTWGDRTFSSLHLLPILNKPKHAALLLKFGANPNQIVSREYFRGKLYGADILKTADGNTYFMAAIVLGADSQVIQSMIEAGADVYIANRAGKNAIQIANDIYQKVKELLEEGIPSGMKIIENAKQIKDLVEAAAAKQKKK